MGSLLLYSTCRRWRFHFSVTFPRIGITTYTFSFLLAILRNVVRHSFPNLSVFSQNLVGFVLLDTLSKMATSDCLVKCNAAWGMEKDDNLAEVQITMQSGLGTLFIGFKGKSILFCCRSYWSHLDLCFFCSKIQILFETIKSHLWREGATSSTRKDSMQSIARTSLQPRVIFKSFSRNWLVRNFQIIFKKLPSVLIGRFNCLHNALTTIVFHFRISALLGSGRGLCEIGSNGQ